MRNRTLSPLLAALALAAWPAFANIPSKVYVATSPPPPLAEDTAPAERAGHVWVPGHWTWTGSQYEWKKGRHVAERKGHRYVAPQWVMEEGRWTLYPEKWVMNEDDKEKTAATDSSMSALR